MTGMITEDELLNLPDDPELAFVHFERLARAKLDRALSEADENESTDRYELDYMSNVLGAAKAYEIEGLTHWDLPQVVNADAWMTCREFRAAAEHIAIQLHIRHTQRLRKYSVHLDLVSKEKMRHHLASMKSIIDGAEWPQPRKGRLLDRIHALEVELERNRVRYETIGALVIDGPDEIPGIVERWADAARQVLKVLRKAKETEDERRVQLPPADPPKRLGAPKKLIAPPKTKRNGFSKSLDDDIPF